MASELDERTSSSDDGLLLVLRLQQKRGPAFNLKWMQMVWWYLNSQQPFDWRLAHPRGGSCAWCGKSARLGVLRTCTMELVEWRRRW